MFKFDKRFMNIFEEKKKKKEYIYICIKLSFNQILYMET